MIILSGILFIVSALFMWFSIIEYSKMRTAMVFMENTFKENSVMVDGLKTVVQNGFESAEEQYSSVMKSSALAL